MGTFVESIELYLISSEAKATYKEIEEWVFLLDKLMNVSYTVANGC